MILTTLFCSIDDFMKEFSYEWDKNLLSLGYHKRGLACCMSDAEMMTIIILFHQSNYRTFKHFYKEYVAKTLFNEFPHLLSYSPYAEAKKLASA